MYVIGILLMKYKSKKYMKWPPHLVSKETDAMFFLYIKLRLIREWRGRCGGYNVCCLLLICSYFRTALAAPASCLYTSNYSKCSK